MKYGRENADKFVGDKSLAPSYALLAVLVLLLAAATFHPYFFGDEIGFLHVAAYWRLDFWQTYVDLNTYKPRLVFNFMWALFGATGALRATVMATFALGMFLCAAMVFRMAMRLPDGSRKLAWLAAAVIVTSRFGAMLYYDYLSGTIEVWSLALLLAGLSCLFDPDRSIGTVGPRRLFAACIFFVAAVFVHERYVAAVAAVGGFIVLDACRLFRKDRRAGTKVALIGIAMAVVPLVLFLVAARALSSNPLLVGTAGRVVSLGTDTLWSATTYVSNVLLGTNFGNVWFVGKLTQDSAMGRVLFCASATVFLIAWLWPVWRRRVAFDRDWTPMLAMISIALIAVASLPGLDLQQARWMFPVQAMLVLLVLVSYRGHARTVLLLLMLCTSIVYVGFGSYWEIASIKASRLGRELATMLNTSEKGRRGFIYNDIDARWTLTGGPYIHNNGDSGTVFCSVNVATGACMDPVLSNDARDLAGYDFGVQATSPAAYGRPQYRKVSADSLRTEVNPGSIPDGVGKVIGRGRDWTGWRWSRQPTISDKGLVLLPGMDGFVEFGVREVADRFLVYRASAIGPSSVSMRLQVNWQAPSGIVGATIQVVEVRPGIANFATLLSPPPGARTALIYATLHGEPDAGVLLDSIRLVDQQDATKQ